MKYFTPDKYVAFQNFEESAMNAADAVWEDAVDRYDAYLQTILPELSESVRQLLNDYYLHDADVLSMGQREDTFVIVLQLGVPPHDLLTITYSLANSPTINEEALPIAYREARPQWMHDEIELVREDAEKLHVHSILFSNGWEVQLRFRDVRMNAAHSMFPVSPKPAEASHTERTSRSA